MLSQAPRLQGTQAASGHPVLLPWPTNPAPLPPLLRILSLETSIDSQEQVEAVTPWCPVQTFQHSVSPRATWSSRSKTPGEGQDVDTWPFPTTPLPHLARVMLGIAESPDLEVASYPWLLVTQALGPSAYS